MTHPINVGLIGLGRAGWGMHCPELDERADSFRIVAACDVIASRRERMAERYGCRVYEDVAQLLKDPDVELVDIATRSCDHYAHATAALAAGKDVLLEKPMTVSYAEAKSLCEAARQAPGTLYVRHNRRFDPDFLQVREIIDSGILGDVYEIRLARHGYQRRDDWQTLKAYGGGQLLNWGPHIIDHALRFLASPIADQYSDLKCVAAAGDAEDHLKIVLRGGNGRLVDLEISGGVALGSATYRVFGTRGSLVLTGEEVNLRYLDPEQALTPRTANPGTPGETFGQPEDLVWIEETLPVRAGTNHIVWDHLFAAIREGAIYPISLDQAVAVMAVVSAAKAGTGF